MSDFEKLLAFDKLSTDLNEEAKKELANFLNIDLESFQKRIEGKHKEYEFILAVYLTKKFKKIVAYDESISQISGENTVDYKVIDEKGKSYIIEVKHTSKNIFSLSEKQISEKIKFAKSENAELFFAISIRGFWMLFTANYLKKEKKISIEKDLKKSKLYEFLGITTYLFTAGIKIVTVYSKKDPINLGIENQQYGKLISFEFFYKNKKIFEVNPDNRDFFSLILFLEGFFDKIKEVSQKVISGEDKTYMIEYFDDFFTFVNEIELLLSPIKHRTYDDNKKYTIPIYFNKLIEGKESIDENVTLEKIRYAIAFLVKKNVLIYHTPNMKEIYQVSLM